MENNELFKGNQAEPSSREFDFGEDVGLEKIWSVSDEEYLAILKERFPKGKKTE